MLQNFLDFFVVLLSNTCQSTLFTAPIVLCLCSWLVLLVLNMVRGRY